MGRNLKADSPARDRVRAPRSRTADSLPPPPSSLRVAKVGANLGIARLSVSVSLSLLTFFPPPCSRRVMENACASLRPNVPGNPANEEIATASATPSIASPNVLTIGLPYPQAVAALLPTTDSDASIAATKLDTMSLQTRNRRRQR
jgi:hypothetical protein